jgi:hypothetical protein
LRNGADGDDAAALLVLLGVALVEDDSVADLHAGCRNERAVSQFVSRRIAASHEHALARMSGDDADADAAGFGETGVDEGLVVGSVEEAVGEAARKTLGEVEGLSF